MLEEKILFRSISKALQELKSQNRYFHNTDHFVQSLEKESFLSGALNITIKSYTVYAYRIDNKKPFRLSEYEVKLNHIDTFNEKVFGLVSLYLSVLDKKGKPAFFHLDAHVVISSLI